MELAATGRDGSYRNGLLEHVAMEAIYIYPLVKSSDLANGRLQKPSKHLLVTQKRVGEATHPIQKIAPKTWDYLMKHADLLGGRRSAVYASQPRFAIFGVGEYTFAQWKVAVSGLHKSLQFHVVPPFENKPTLLDDTCYFIACASEEEARFLALLLNSEIASAFYSAFMFPDAKRPVTAEMLRRLDLLSLARELGKEEEYRIYQPSILIQDDNPGHQLSLALPGVSEPDNKRLF